MQNTFVYSFIDKRHGWEKEFGADCFVVARDCRSQFLDRRTQFAAVAAVDLITLCVLPNAFLC